MNSREIVRRTLDFDCPERVARSFGDSDLVFVGCAALTRCDGAEWREVGGGRGQRLDAWGNTWGRCDSTSKGEVVKGGLDDLAKVAAHPFPDYCRPEDYVSVKRERAAAGARITRNFKLTDFAC